MNWRFSRRLGWDLRPNALSVALAARRRDGGEIIDLTRSNPTRAGLAYPAALWEALGAVVDGPYEPQALGLFTAREGVAAYYREKGQQVAGRDVVLTASTSEAYGLLFKVWCDAGDEVLVPRPSYPLFEYLAGLEAVAVRTYPLRLGEGGWRIDLDWLAASLSERSRAVVLVHPNNPTGSYITAAEREGLEALARERGLVLVADEVFADYALDAAADRVDSFVVDATVPTFVLSGLSKVLGLPQLKLGWMVVAGPEDVQRQALARLEVAADAYLSVGGAVQRALPDLLAQRGVMQRQIHARLAANRARLIVALKGCARARLLPCQGGWYAVVEVDVAAGDWAVSLLQQEGVLLHPGHFYDFQGDRAVVLSLLVEERDMAEGMGRLLSHLDS